MTAITTAPQWIRLLGGLVTVFALFHLSARALGSDRGQAGIAVAVLVVTATLAIERLVFGQRLASAARSLGFGRPAARGVVAAVAICVALLLVVPAYARISEARMSFFPGWWWLLPGLFAQGGIAEEVLFRGYLFGRIRRGRSFWHAAGLSMLPFAAVHLLLFFTMPWPIALAALLLSVVLSIPFAHLFEVGGGTVWGPALVHFVCQATVKVVAFPDTAVFPLVWMLASAVIPLAVLLVPRRGSRGDAERHSADPTAP